MMHVCMVTTHGVFQLLGGVETKDTWQHSNVWWHWQEMHAVDNCIMSSAWKECNMLCTVLTKLQWSHFDEKYTVHFLDRQISYTRAWWQCWLCALKCECRGSFVTSQRLLHGDCCPPQMKLAAGGTSVSSATLHGQSVRCNCAWSDTRPRPHYSWTVAAASQKSWNIHCLVRGYVNTNRRRLLRYQDQLRRWIWCSFLRDRSSGLPVCASHVRRMCWFAAAAIVDISKDNVKRTTKLLCFGSQKQRPYRQFRCFICNAERIQFIFPPNPMRYRPTGHVTSGTTSHGRRSSPRVKPRLH